MSSTRTRVEAELTMPDGRQLVEVLRNPAYPQNLGRLRRLGGGVEKGETPQQALIRELDEEVGCRVNESQLELIDTQQRPDCLAVIFRVSDHGLQPGRFDNAKGGDSTIYLVLDNNMS